MQKLPVSFYLQDDVVSIGKHLLGKYLFTYFDQKLTGGKIVETESYIGTQDKASHAYGGRLTKRTKTLYKKGGISYVYFCYGMHHLLNVVTNKQNIPHAVLIRAIEPTEGIDIMMERTKKKKLAFSLTAGPGSLTKALGIALEHNELSFRSSILWIEDRNTKISSDQILCSPRVGVAYAKEDALLPLRFRIKENPWTSPSK